MGLRRFFRPAVLLRRKAVRTGLFGGDRKWLTLWVVMFLWRRIKALFGFGEPEPVLIEDVKPGQRFVVAHEDSAKSLRKKGKVAKKAKKREAKGAAKTAKKAAKKTAKQAARLAARQAAKA